MHFLITAGPTREAIDPIRFLSNRSSGKMGYAIAKAALEAGHRVTLISGPVAIDAPKKAKLVRILSAENLWNAIESRMSDVDIVVMTAAVADFRPERCEPHKIKRTGLTELRIRLVPTRDILRSLHKKRQKNEKKFHIVGFAAETQNLRAFGAKKLAEKQCDLLVANDVSRPEIGLESQDNEVHVFWKNGDVRKISRAPKIEIARKLVAIFSELRKKDIDVCTRIFSKCVLQEEGVKHLPFQKTQSPFTERSVRKEKPMPLKKKKKATTTRKAAAKKPAAKKPAKKRVVKKTAAKKTVKRKAPAKKAVRKTAKRKVARRATKR